MANTFTRDEIKLLAESERRMDAGLTPFVILGTQRVSATPACMDALGLTQGQTINDTIFLTMLRWNIADLEEKIEERRFQERG